MKRSWGWSFGGRSLSARSRYRDDNNVVERKVKVPKAVNQTLSKNKVANVLVKLGDSLTSGVFAINGLLQLAPTTGICLKDGTVIKFPVYVDELPALIPKLQQSPFGLGEATVLDTSFRNSWQLDPSGFTILNKEWDKYMKNVVVPMISKELEITTPIGANLYKLLLYKTGSFFKAHRDTEKEDRMFGTLVVQMPSKFSGGQLVVRHDGKAKDIDFSTKSRSEEYKAFYSAFYCDCEHEILPLTDGVRVCLIYNLILTGEPILVIPKAPSMLNEKSTFITVINEWKDEQRTQEEEEKISASEASNDKEGAPPKSVCFGNDVQMPNNETVPDVPEKLVYIFSHQYTQASLSYEALKSGDKAVATMLKDLAEETNLCALMGILEKKTNGDCCGSDFDSSDEDCYAEKDYTLTHLSILAAAEQDVVTAFTKNKKKLVFPTEENEIIPLNRLRALQPYKQKRQPTGNEGVKITLQYNNAALVIFPKESLLTMLISGKETGRAIAEQLFLTKCKKINVKKASPNDAELKADVIKCGDFLKFGGSTFRTPTTNPQLLKLFNALVSVNDATLLSKFFTGYRQSMIAHIDDMLPVLLKTTNVFGWNYISGELIKIFESFKNPMKSLSILNIIVNSSIGNQERKVSCREIVTVILKEIQDEEKRISHNLYFHSNLKLSAIQQIEFLDAMCVIAKKIGADISDFFKTRTPTVAIPCLIKLASNNRSKLAEPWLQIAKDFAGTLKSETSKVMAEPEWRKRSDFRACGQSTCKDCPAVQKFMLSSEIAQSFLNLSKTRVQHIQCQMPHADLLTIPQQIGKTFSFTITKKQRAVHIKNIEKQAHAREQLIKLNAILTANGCAVEEDEVVPDAEDEIVIIST